jgi:demethylmenaquinone methyltransferase/2-methoxy-6-polyprenyl-1,4-benzoquinol methylase
MFDRIAGRYDRLNRVLSLGLDRRWRRRLVRALACGEGARVLDLATGTADVALAVVDWHPTARVVGLDPSREMLAVGREKVARAERSEQIELVRGDAQRLDFADDSFDACCMAFGIRNVPDRVAALREMARVTRPNGRVVVLELGQPRGPMGPLARLYVHRVVPRLGGWLSGAEEYRYLQTSIAAFPAPDAFLAMLREAGLARPRARRLSFGAAYLFVAEAPARDELSTTSSSD